MNLETSRLLVPRLLWLAEAGSTNTELATLAQGPDAAGWPDRSVVATDTQTGGRGRLGRVWSAPAGSSLAISVLLRPVGASGEPLALAAYGWLPLLAGAAMTCALAELLGARATATMKWPNDVLLTATAGERDGGGASIERDDAAATERDDATTERNDAAATERDDAATTERDDATTERKVCGILSELLPGGDGGAPAGVVIGAGVNVSLTADQLPVPTATSLAIAGAADLTADDVLAAYLAAFTSFYEPFLAADGDALASGLVGAVSEVSATLGRLVRVELPGGDVATGRATGFDDTGRLVVERDDTPHPTTLVVSAGDVTHLRHAARDA